MSEEIELAILKAIRSYDGSCTLDNPFEELLSFGELVDRLSIINFKLYTLKDEVAKRTSDQEFCSWAAIEDIRLVKERSRLKACIDKKLIAVLERYKSGDITGGFNQEVKKYGDLV